MLSELEDIINDCIAGDRTSQYKVYNLLAPKLRVVCKRYMATKEEAEDCLQDAFIKIFTNIKDFRGDCELAGWARKITVNVLISKLEKNKKFAFETLDNEAENLFQYSDVDPSSDLSQAFLLSVIDKLPQEKKIVFNLHAIEGYNHKEIADILNITEVHSRNILFSARKALFAHLQKIKSGYEQGITR